MYYERLTAAVQMIADEMTLKADYTEELDRLDSIYTDIAVIRKLGTPVCKCEVLKEKINEIREWIKQETA